MKLQSTRSGISKRAREEFKAKRKARERELWLKTRDMEEITTVLIREGFLPVGAQFKSNVRTVYSDFEEIFAELDTQDVKTLKVMRSFYLRKLQEYMSIGESLLARAIPRREERDGAVRVIEPDVHPVIAVSGMRLMESSLRSLAIIAGLDVNGKQTLDLNLKGAEEHANDLMRIQQERMKQRKRGKVVDLKKIAEDMDDGPAYEM